MKNMMTLESTAAGLAAVKYRKKLSVNELAIKLGIGREKTRRLLRGEDVSLTFAQRDSVMDVINGKR